MSEILTILTNLSFIVSNEKSVHVLVIIVNMDKMHGEKLKICRRDFKCFNVKFYIVHLLVDN